MDFFPLSYYKKSKIYDIYSKSCEVYITGLNKKALAIKNNTLQAVSEIEKHSISHFNRWKNIWAELPEDF